MSAVDDKDVVSIEKWFGLRNTVKPEAFELGDLQVALDVDIDDELKMRRRTGFDAALVSGDYHSLFAAGTFMLGMDGTALKRVLLSGSAVTLRSGLTGERVAYVPVGPRIYYSDGRYTGCVDGGTDRSWGIAPPVRQPTATATSGYLPAGRYQFAITYLRADGQESGTGTAGVIELAAGSDPAVAGRVPHSSIDDAVPTFGSAQPSTTTISTGSASIRGRPLPDGGISFSSIPVPSDSSVVAKRLYVSSVNGDKLYAAMTLPASATTASYTRENLGHTELMTQFLQPPIAGTVLAFYAGRVLIARGNRLYRTETFSPELLDLRRSYTFLSPITVLAPVEDGVWVGTQTEMIFLGGSDPAKWDYRPRASYGAIAGAVTAASESDLDPNAPEVPIVLVGTTQGICACLNGGIIKNLTKERFSYPATERGAAVVRSHGGMTQCLLTLEGTETAANAAF